MKQIFTGLKEMHKRKIVHRDLNTSNVLVSSVDQKIKIIDFNVAKDCSRASEEP
jgi:serine/threonine protein kinase